jgi:hypothetical protein
MPRVTNAPSATPIRASSGDETRSEKQSGTALGVCVASTKRAAKNRADENRDAQSGIAGIADTSLKRSGVRT